MGHSIAQSFRAELWDDRDANRNMGSRSADAMTKTPKRPRDPAQLAKFIVDVATGDVEEPQGVAPNRAKGGRKGGKARARSLTPQERSEIAQTAAAARWKKG